MKKQYLPIIVRKDGTHGYAKCYSKYSKRIGDKFCWSIEEAKACIEDATQKLNNKKPTTVYVGGIGITSEHYEPHEVVDSYIKVREVTEWEVIKG